MNLDIISNISKIGSEAWNNLNINDHPFTNYDFLYALENLNLFVQRQVGFLNI